MSGSSAMASARRRRAGNPDPPTQSSHVVNENNNLEVSSSQRMTPLQILKIHDDKLKILEECINKINLTDQTNNNVLNTNSNINTNIDKVNELNEIKFEQLNTKIGHLSEIVKSLHINIENISKLNIIENDQYKIINDGILEMNNLKNLIIDTQKDIINIKNDISLSKSLHDKHDSILQNLNFENTDNDAEMLFKSVLEEQLNTNFSFDKISISNDEEYDINDINISNDIEVVTINNNYDNNDLSKNSNNNVDNNVVTNNLDEIEVNENIKEDISVTEVTEVTEVTD